MIVDTHRQRRTPTELMNFTSYDAAYLELALREGLALATLDEELKRVANKLGVTTL
jgi:predicted nucleic acid-binding protein